MLTLTSAGNYYSSINDMLAFGISVLKNLQLSPVRTRRWLKPLTSTSASHLLVGAPWEIYRLMNVTNDGRMIEIYTKLGNIFDYNSNFVLVPDYDLVIQVFSAGPETNAITVMAATMAALKHLLPALDEAGKDETRTSHTGTFVDTVSNSSITLSLDDENPGIRVSNWTVRGVDVVGSLPIIATAFIGGPVGGEAPTRLRIYPTGLETENQSSWRGVWTAGTPEELVEIDSLFLWPMGTCFTWAQVDRTQYGLQSQDHFIFTFEHDKNGKSAISLELPFYRVTLRRNPIALGLDTDETQRPLIG